MMMMMTMIMTMMTMMMMPETFPLLLAVHHHLPDPGSRLQDVKTAPRPDYGDAYTISYSDDHDHDQERDIDKTMMIMKHNIKATS